MSKTLHQEFELSGQAYRLQLIERTDWNQVFRYTVKLDTSYPTQSSVYVEVLPKKGDWVRLADLYTGSFADAPSAHETPRGQHERYALQLVTRLRKVAEAIV